MRHATVNEMNDSFLRADAKGNAWPQIGGLGHLQSHEVSGKLGRNDTSWCLKRNLTLGACRLVCKPRKAARAVPAHLRFSPIGVKVAHSEIGVVRSIFPPQNSVRSDTAVAITKARDLAAI